MSELYVQGSLPCLANCVIDLTVLARAAGYPLLGEVAAEVLPRPASATVRPNGRIAVHAVLRSAIQLLTRR
jgi:hypothetical protein